MLKAVLIGAVIAAGGAIGFAAPAQADDHSFLLDLGRHIAIHDAEKMVRDGHLACDLRQDHPNDDELARLLRHNDRSLSKGDSGAIVGSTHGNLC